MQTEEEREGEIMKKTRKNSKLRVWTTESMVKRQEDENKEIIQIQEIAPREFERFNQLLMVEYVDINEREIENEKENLKKEVQEYRSCFEREKINSTVLQAIVREICETSGKVPLRYMPYIEQLEELRKVKSFKDAIKDYCNEYGISEESFDPDPESDISDDYE